MAGNLSGLKFEARSTASGIHVGSSAMSVNSFARKFYLPQVGGTFMGEAGAGSALTLNAAQQMKLFAQVGPMIVRQIIQELGIKRDTGGPLLPGQAAVNVSGGRERVLSAAETEIWENSTPVTAQMLRDALDGATLVLRDPLGKVVAGQLATAGQRGPR